MDSVIKQSDNFWFNDPEILINKERLLEFFPNADMTLNEKLNSFIRLSVYISLFLFFYHKKTQIMLLPIFVALITLYIFRYNNIQTKEEKTENYETLIKCQMPTDDNPFMNTLVSDVGMYKPKKEACSLFEDVEVEEEVKQRFDKGLFKDVNDIYGKGNSQRQFFTMPNTNEYGIKHGDTEKLGNWLYNTGKPSCKEDTEYCTGPNNFYNEELRNKPHLILR